MSGRSVTITIGTTGSIRTTTATTGSSNGVKLAGDESKDKMYEPKHSKKMVRVLTVIAYMFTVSLAAIMLSTYYVFLWNPPAPRNLTAPASCAPSKPSDGNNTALSNRLAENSPSSAISNSSSSTESCSCPTLATLDEGLNTSTMTEIPRVVPADD